MKFSNAQNFEFLETLYNYVLWKRTSNLIITPTIILLVSKSSNVVDHCYPIFAKIAFDSLY